MKKEDLIMRWEYTVSILDALLNECCDKDDTMFAIMIARKNQLLACIADLKKLTPSP